ncbi:hypothetical protein DENSPDRAFT_763200, partial [Dentipellis sp. KUC8613]
IAVPRPSASLIVVNSQNEVLMVHRNPQATSFGGVHVFPGGNYDAKQDESYQMTAIRETFEESGLLLASSQSQSASRSQPALDDKTLETSRESIHAQGLLFKDFLRTHNLSADVSSLLPFTEWVTPQLLPRRFHTRFYVAFLPAIPSAGFASGATQHRLPTPDGGQEVVAAHFVHPQAALAAFRARRIQLMPPQYYLLTTLADILYGAHTTPAQAARVRALAAGAFGRMVVNPRALPGLDKDGRSVLTYEGDEARGGPVGRLHRSLVRPTGRGGCTEIVLLRNFDIFADI